MQGLELQPHSAWRQLLALQRRNSTWRNSTPHSRRMAPRRIVQDSTATFPGHRGNGVDNKAIPMLQSFMCPITKEALVDPVTTADGHLYERRAIEEWLRHHNTSPVTGKSLPSVALTPEPRIRRAIEEYRHLPLALNRSSIANVARLQQAQHASMLNDISQQVERLKEGLDLPEAEFRAETTEVIHELEAILETPHDPNPACGRFRGSTNSAQEREQLVCLAVFNGHDKNVNAVDTLTEDRVVSGSGDGTVKIWEVPNRRCTATFKGHAASVSSVTRLGSNHVVSGSWDSCIRVWSLGLHHHGSFTLADCGCKVHSVTAVSASSVACGLEDGQLQLWDVARQSQILTLTGHNLQVLGVTRLNDQMMMSCSGDRTVKLWDLRTKRCSATMQGHGGSVRDVIALPGNRLASCSSDGSIKIWDLASQCCLFSLHGHMDSVWSVALVGNSRLVSGSMDGTVRLWELRDSTCCSILHEHSGGVSKVAASGTNLFSGSLDHTVRAWGSLPDSTY